MEQEKSNKGVIALLVIIIVALAALCVLFATGKINFRSNNQNNNNQSNVGSKDNNQNSSINDEIINSVKVVAGKYQYKDDRAVDSENKPNPTTFTLDLYENGTFKYQLNDQYTPVGVIGNYTIEKNKIILNYLFNTGSSSDLNITKGTKELTIDTENSITGSVKSKDHKSNINVKFKKSSENTDEFDFNTLLMIGVHQQTKIDEANM